MKNDLRIPAVFDPFLDVDRMRSRCHESGMFNPERMEILLAEAAFFLPIIEPRLTRVDRTRPVLEIGGGIGALSLLVSSRLQVHIDCLEPMSAGFEQMAKLRKLLLYGWRGKPDVEFFETGIEEFLEGHGRYGSAFSVNVLEHAAETSKLISTTHSLLTPDSSSIHIFPNYAIPYENHFEIPIVINKDITFSIFRRKILASKSVSDPLGQWQELNFLTATKIGAIARQCGLSASFSKNASTSYLGRLREPNFLGRKSRLYTILASIIPLLSLILHFLPTKALPIVEVELRSAGL